MIIVKPPNFRELGDACVDEVLKSFSCEVGVPLGYGVHWAVLLSLLLHHGQETSALEAVLRKITGKKCIDKRLVRKVSNSICGFNPFLDRFALFYDVALKNVVKAFFQKSLRHREKYIQQKINEEKDFPDNFLKKSKTEFWIDTIGHMLKCDIYLVKGDSCENVYISRCSKGSSDESKNHDNVKESSSKFDTGVKILLFGEREKKILYVTSFGLSEERGKELLKLSTESIEKLFENFQGRRNEIRNFFCLEEVNQKLISILSNAAVWKRVCEETNDLFDDLKASLNYESHHQREYYKENTVLLYLMHENCMYRVFDVDSSTDELERMVVDFHFKMDAIFQSLTQVQDNRSIKLLDVYDFETDFLKKFTAVNEPLESEDLKKKLHDIFQAHFGHFASEKHRGIRDFEEQTSYLFFTTALFLCDRFSELFLEEEEMQTNFIHIVFLCLQHCIWGRKSSFFPAMRTFLYGEPEEFGRHSITSTREGKEKGSMQGPVSVKEVLSEHFAIMRLKHYLHLASTADIKNNFVVSCLVIQRAVQVLRETVKHLRGYTSTVSNVVSHVLESQLEELLYAHGILCPESPDYITTRMHMENNADGFLALQRRLVRICNSMTWFFTFQSKRAKTYYLQSVTTITPTPEKAPKVGPLSYECMKIVLTPEVESFHIKNFLLYADALLREYPKKSRLIRDISGLFGSLHKSFHCISILDLYLDVHLRERRQSQELRMFRSVLNASLKQHKGIVSLVFPYISVTKTLDKKVLDKLVVKKAQSMPEQHLFRKESHSCDEKVRVKQDSSTTTTHHKTDQYRPSCKGNLGVEAQSMTFFREKSHDDSEMSSSKATGQAGSQCSAIATSVVHRKLLLKSESESMSVSPKSSFRERANANYQEEPKVLHASKQGRPGARFWFLLDRIKKLKNLLIDSNNFLATMWDKVKSEKAKDFVHMQLVSMFSSQPSLQASLEALLFDCMNLIEDNDSEMGSSLGHLWQKIDNVFNTINIRNYFADVDARFRIVGKAFDNFCLSNEVIKVALKLVSEIDKLEAVYKMKIEVSSDYETLVDRIENDDYDEYFSTLCKTIKFSSSWKLYVKMATQ